MGFLDYFSIIINWLHAVSVSVWLGGCCLLVLYSTHEKSESTDNSKKVFSKISVIFRELVNSSMIIIFISGIVMTVEKLSLVETSPTYLGILSFKIALSFWVMFRIWSFRKIGYPRYENKYKEWILGYYSFIIWGVLIFFLAELLAKLT